MVFIDNLEPESVEKDGYAERKVGDIGGDGVEECVVAAMASAAVPAPDAAAAMVPSERPAPLRPLQEGYVRRRGLRRATIIAAGGLGMRVVRARRAL